MPESGTVTSRSRSNTLRGSFHDAMAALIGAIASKAPAEVERPSPAPPPSVAAPVAAAQAHKPYDIEDAVAEVAQVAAVMAGKPAAKPEPEWQPISTAPFDRDVQVGVNVESGVLPIFFPCRLTDSGWTNAIVRAPLFHEPTCWRDWPER
jgi:hypothetical protein